MRPMRLMTANLLYRNGATPQALRQALDVVKPDLLAVQELTPELTSTITDRFPYHLLTARPDGPGTGFAADRLVDLDQALMPYRSGVVATLQPDEWPEFNGPVEVLNAHFANPIERWPRAMARARRGQIEAIEDRAETAPDRRLLCGDLNASPAWPAYRRLRRSYRDGIGDFAAARGTRPSSTWAPSRRGPRFLRIDHVLVRGLRVVSAEALRLTGSDHFALVVDVAEE